MTKMTTKTLNANQAVLVADLLKHFKGETKVSRKQLRDAHGELRGKKASPYFITKNNACKVKDAHGMYNLAVFNSSLKANQKRAAKEAAAETE